jgi:glycosyltransferase involved in cell wall biosynthesis
MKVLQVIHTTGHGGAENIFRWLAWQLSKEGVDVVACIPSRDPRRPEYWIGPALEELGVPIVTFAREGSPLQLLSRLRAVISREKPDVVHSHLLDANFYSSVACRLLSLPHVCTEHGDMAIKKSVADRGKFAILSLASASIVCVSESIRQTARKISLSPGKLSVIHNGVVFSGDGASTLRQELGIPDGALLVGNVANLYPVKGHVHLIRAFAAFLRDFPDARLVIVGRGRERESLVALVRGLCIPDGRVFLTGFRSDVENIMKALDIFVLPSLSEGLPVALLEAMSAGVPIIATRVGGVPEVLGENRHGTLVAPGAWEELRSALTSVALDLEAQRRRAETARGYVKEFFSLDAMAKKYVAVYESALR